MPFPAESFGMTSPSLAVADRPNFTAEAPRRSLPRPSERILRSGAFLEKVRPLRMSEWLRPLLAAHRGYAPEAWVLMAAEELSARASRPVPQIWLDKLSNALHVRSVGSLRPSFDSLPKALWSEPALLGGFLAMARELAAPEREGRAGRVSAGVVYTPSAVARAMIAELKVGSRRVVDPACGAGAFLLEAFQRGYRRRLEGGETARRAAQSVLANELTGVDIDAKALAVAEFSLRMAGLRTAALDATEPIDLRLADALRPLAGLDGNCECIAGNPPFIEGRGLSAEELSALRDRFHCARAGKVNLFAVFIERAMELLKENGVMAFIVPATFQRNARYQLLREYLLKHTIEAIRPLEKESFEGHAVETVVLRVRKRPPLGSSRVKLHGGQMLQSQLPLGPVLRFCDHLPRALRRQIELMERHGVPLGNCFDVRDGISTGFQPFPHKLLGKVDGRNFIDAGGAARPFDPKLHRRVIDGSEFNSFTPVAWEGRFIEYDKAHEHHPPHPGRPFNCQLRDPNLYDRAEKLLTRQTARGIIATVDRERYFVRNSVHVTFQKPDSASLSLDALCACLNSRFYSDYFLAVTGENGDIFPQVHIADLKRIPILPGLLLPDSRLAAQGAELLALHRNADTNTVRIAELKALLETELAAAFGIHD